MSVVGHIDLGGLGANESEPFLIEWHWYYHLQAYPNVAPWGLIGVLLVLVRANRNWRAWTILIPFVVLGEVVSRWIEPLFATLFVGFGNYGLAFQWLVISWTALWLVAPWLAKCRPPAAFALALILATAIGLGEYFGIYQNRGFGQPLTGYLAWVLALVTAVGLTAISCRKSYSPGRFLLWLVPWLTAAAMGCVIGEHIVVSSWISGAGRGPGLLESMPELILLSLCIAAILYLLNLPYMCLAFYVGPYRERFQNVLHLPADPLRTTTRSVVPNATDALAAVPTGQVLTASVPQSEPLS